MSLNLRTPNGYDGSKATSKKMGIVRFSTDAEALAASAEDVALTPGQAVDAIPDASETVKGKIELATNAEAVTGTDAVRAVVPAGLTARLAAPGAIGGTTPAAGTFTTVNATTFDTNVAAAGVTLAGTTLAADGTDANISITVTPKGTGNLDLSAGNLLISGAGKQLQIEGGAVTDFIGQATLTAGTVTVLNTNIAAADKIFVSRQSINGSTALGVFDVAITPATSFSITALKTADATTETNDISIVDYVIVRQL